MMQCTVIIYSAVQFLKLCTWLACAVLLSALPLINTTNRDIHFALTFLGTCVSERMLCEQHTIIFSFLLLAWLPLIKWPISVHWARAFVCVCVGRAGVWERNRKSGSVYVLPMSDCSLPCLIACFHRCVCVWAPLTVCLHVDHEELTLWTSVRIQHYYLLSLLLVGHPLGTGHTM